MIKKILYDINEKFDWLGRCTLLALMLSVLSLTIMRRFPITMVGVFESTTLFAVITYAASWGLTQVEKRHISVEFVASHLPQCTHLVTKIIAHLISIATCVVMTWSSVLYARWVYIGHEIISKFMPIPKFVLVSLVAFGFILVGSVLVLQLVDLLRGELRKK